MTRTPIDKDDNTERYIVVCTEGLIPEQPWYTSEPIGDSASLVPSPLSQAPLGASARMTALATHSSAREAVYVNGYRPMPVAIHQDDGFSSRGITLTPEGKLRMLATDSPQP